MTALYQRPDYPPRGPATTLANFSAADLDELAVACNKPAGWGNVPSAAGEHFSTKGRAPTWNAQDHVSACFDILAARMGHPAPGASLHPLANQMLEAQSDWSLTDLAKELLAQRYGPQAKTWDLRAVMASGTSTADLAPLLANSANRVVFARAPRLLDRVLAVTTSIETRDYRETTAGTVELDVGIEDASGALRPWQTMTARAAGEALALRMSPIRLRFSEQAIVNDDVNAFAATVAAVTTAAAQNEAAALFSILNAPPTLSDGAALFVTANTVSGASKSAAGLDSAIAKLRGMTLNGAACDADPVNLICPAADEGTVRTIVSAMSIGAPFLRVVPSALLTAGAWFLQADPVTWPTLVRATQRGSEGQSLRLYPGKPNEREGNRDAILEGGHVYDYGAVSRVGLVKITVT